MAGRLIGRAWRRWRRLSGAERRTLVAAWLLLPGLSAALRLAGTHRTVRALASTTVRERPSGEPAAQAAEGERVALLVCSAARWSPVRTTCLTRSLALWWLLRRRGIAASLRIGVLLDAGLPSSVVQRPSSRLEAHAWVECDGVAVGDGANMAGRYQPFEG